MNYNEQIRESAPGTENPLTGQLDQQPQYDVDELIELIAHVRYEINNTLTGVYGQTKSQCRDAMYAKSR
jgi:hypothetical protein